MVLKCSIRHPRMLGQEIYLKTLWPKTYQIWWKILTIDPRNTRNPKQDKSACMHMHTLKHMHIYIYTQTHAHICTYTYVHTNTHILTPANIHAGTYTGTHTYTYIHTYIRIQTYIHIHSYTKCTHIYRCTNTHIPHTHTHTNNTEAHDHKISENQRSSVLKTKFQKGFFENWQIDMKIISYMLIYEELKIPG